MQEKNNQEKILEKIYEANSEKIDTKLKNTYQNIKEKLKEIDFNDIKIEINDKNLQEKLTKILKIQEENNNIKISEYCKEMYKEGFKDGIKLIIECME